MSELVVQHLMIQFCHDPVGCAVVSVLGAQGTAAYVGMLASHSTQIHASWNTGVGQLAAWRDALLPKVGPDPARAQWEWQHMLRPGHGRHRCGLCMRLARLVLRPVRRAGVVLSIVVALNSTGTATASGTTHAPGEHQRQVVA